MTVAPSGDEPAVGFSQQSEDLLERFDSAWQEGRTPQIEAFLQLAHLDSVPLDEARQRSLLEELIKIDVEYRWRRRKPKATQKDGTTLREEAVGGGYLTDAEFTKLVRPEKMIGPK